MLAAPAPSLQAAVDAAVSFTAKYPIVSVRLFEARKLGTAFVMAYEPFIVGEPEQGQGGMVFTLLGTFKAGSIVR